MIQMLLKIKLGVNQMLFQHVGEANTDVSHLEKLTLMLACWRS